MLNVYLMIAIAAVANVATVYFMKLSAGLTVPWPIFGMLIANLFTNWFLGRAFAGGAPVDGPPTPESRVKVDFVLARIAPQLGHGLEETALGRFAPANLGRLQAGIQDDLGGAGQHHEGRGAVVALAHNNLAVLVRAHPRVVAQDVPQ